MIPDRNASEARTPQLEASLLRLRLQHLRMLVALAESASVHEAAERVRLTQSAASKLLADLERTFGARLFERGRLGLRATAAGRALAERAGRMLRDVATAREEQQLIARGDAVLLRVGGLPVTLATVMPQVLAHSRAAWPALVLQLREASGRQLLRDIEAGVVDCGLGRPLLDEPIDSVAGALRFDPLMPERLVAVVRASHPLARRRRVDVTELVRHDWITPAVGTSPYTELATALQLAGATPPKPALECDASFGTLIAYIRRFPLVGLLPASITADAALLGGLVPVRTPFTVGLPPHAFIARDERFDAAPIARFRQLVREAVPIHDRTCLQSSVHDGPG